MPRGGAGRPELPDPFRLVPGQTLSFLFCFLALSLNEIGSMRSVAAGLGSALGDGRFDFEDGLVIGLPLLAGTAASMLPAEAVASIPPLLRPVAGNGFVVGVVSALALDRLFRRAPRGG